jgi:hypothetical protein
MVEEVNERALPAMAMAGSRMIRFGGIDRQHVTTNFQ